MAIVDYASLQASVASWLHRTDLAAVIPDFIALAESRMNGDLESRSMETRVTLTCAPGARLVALPADMLEMKRLARVGADPVTVLEYRSPDELMADGPSLLRTGRPCAFTVVGGNLELSPAPDSAYPLELVYRQRVPPLSSTNATNWVLQQNPSIYLFGALVASTAYTQDESHLGVWERKYQEARAVINEIDWYSGSTMRVRVR